MIGTIREWCKEQKWPLWRLPFLIWFGIVLVRHLGDPEYGSLLAPLNLGIHEFGHLIFMPLGEPWVTAGGTITQTLVPFYGVYNFWVQRDYFSAVLCFGWLSTNFFNIATYAGDARAMVLPLVTPFGSGDGAASHDWNNMLGAAGWLEADQFIAFLFRAAAVISMLFCLGAGAWMLWLMIIPTGKRECQNEP